MKERRREVKGESGQEATGSGEAESQLLGKRGALNEDIQECV